MLCPSCDAVTETSDCCTECGLMFALGEDEAALSDTATEPGIVSSQNEQQPRKSSTLIEFPGVARSTVPEWRKGLSERVREVQERRAREAAYEAAAAGRQRLETAASPPQLELLPQATMPKVNPLVVAALKRIERAHQGATLGDTRSTRTNAATAVAYSPEPEESEPRENIPVPSASLELDRQLEAANYEPAQPIAEKSHSLVMVDASPPPVTKKAEHLPLPKRLIRDDPNDPALNYLDSISKETRVEEIAQKRASIPRRVLCAVLDLMISAFLCSPVVVAMKMTSNDFRDIRIIAFSTGLLVVMTFIYLTLSIALTGRTWAMRLLSLRVIDTKTGLIPTGGQSVGRAIFYLISLSTVGLLGILYALLSREGYTAHDRLTRTAVISH